jgi:hypothetical protein
MKENIEKVIEWIKRQPVKGCITGSCLLDYFEGQDIDVFLYDEKQFSKLLFAMYYSEDFTILDPLEKWKCEQYINNPSSDFKKFGLTTIKFHYNTCVEVNIIVKKNCHNIFSVLSSFDMDIISKGYDIQTKKYLDLSENLPGKKATWNKWNTSYYSFEIWEISKVLRQLQRCFKYHNRGYNTDLVVEKYIELIDEIQNFDNIFSSKNFDETLKVKKHNTKVLKDICKVWLETHTISDKQIELIKEKIKEI